MEPNSFYHKFGERVNGSQLAADYAALRALLRRYPLFASSRLIGPSITQPDKKSKIKFLNQFLKASGYKSVDAITWHQYYVNGRTASLDQFLNSTILDALAVEMRTAQQRTRHYTHQKHFPIWMGETASAFGGGAPGLSDTYVAGFMWLDKLGMGAVNGIDLIVRQSFYNGHYALINEQSLPNPDYWLTLLYKRLVGPGVLAVSATPRNSNVRIYAHCDNRRITVFAMNLKADDVRLTFADYGGPVDVYEYAPMSGNLTDALITINGRAPSFDDRSVRLRLKPVKSQQPVLLKGFRVIFVVLPLNDVKCAL
uniref:Heparanase n=1 Tax=Plectus sambesii TaxID=2011161 RepID=A0A914V5K7_9BILA